MQFHGMDGTNVSYPVDAESRHLLTSSFKPRGACTDEVDVSLTLLKSTSPVKIGVEELLV